MEHNMAVPQTTGANQTNPEPAYPPLPQFSASGRPNTPLDRAAFQVWVVMFLLVIVVTLVMYLVGWIF
jgi:hypothetical protein